MNQKNFDGWVSVFESGIDYESEMARDRLLDSGIHAVIMTKKDRAFSLSVGALSRIYVLVHPESVDEASRLLAGTTITNEELTEIALASNPDHVDSPVGDSE